MDAPLPQDASETDTPAAILDEVLARFGTTEDARLREIMLSLIPHLHAFVRETKLTWAEWERGMAFFATAACGYRSFSMTRRSAAIVASISSSARSIVGTAHPATG